MESVRANSEAELDAAILSDKLRELGFDYVADVVAGKRQPSESQLMFLRTGHPSPRVKQQGTLLIGGSRDGERVPMSPEQNRPYIQVPVPMNFTRQYTTETYRGERLRCADRDFWYYLINSMETEEGIQTLFTNYRSPNSVENNHG